MKFYTLFLILIFEFSFGQNLIKNNSFEKIQSSENKFGKVIVENWQVITNAKDGVSGLINTKTIKKEEDCIIRNAKDGDILLNFSGARNNLAFQELPNEDFKNEQYLLMFSFYLGIDFPNFTKKTSYDGYIDIVFSSVKLNDSFNIFDNDNSLIINIDIANYELNKWISFRKKIQLNKNYKYVYIGNTKQFVFNVDKLDEWKHFCSEYAIDNVMLISVNELEKYKLDKLKKGDKFALDNIEFSVNSDMLKQESFIILNVLVDYLKANNFNIEISGHTDNTGNFKHNLQLSEARAKAVYNYLIEKGISSSRMSYIGYGSTKPFVENNTNKKKEKNRRVEIEILKTNTR